MIELSTLLHDAGWSALAALGFAMLFNVPRRTLPGCVMAGAAGYSIRLVLLNGGATIEGATLAGAICVGFLSQLFSRRWRTPATIFAVCGVIPMIPGRFAYSTMISLFQLAEMGVNAPQPVLLEASVSAVKTGLILGALAVGIAAPSLFFERHRPHRG